MPSNSFEPTFHVTGRRRWKNWHEFEYPVQQLINVWNGQPDESTVEGYNATTTGFQEVIAEALNNGETVRAVGGGWSFSSVAATDGILLNTRPLNYRFEIDQNHTHADYTGDASNLLFVQCGNSIAELNLYFKEMDKSLKTSGASNGQTIAGALSTGTHGSAIDVGSIQDYVLALHLIVSPERTVWLERESAPVVIDEFPAVFGADLIRDDDIFNAALVNFGSFGIIHGVVIEATDLFYLQAYRQLKEFNQGLRRASEELVFTDVDLPRPNERPYHFQLVINPFDVDSGVYVTVMYNDSSPAADCQPPTSSRIGPGDSATEIAGVIMDIASDLTPVLANLLIRRVYTQYTGVCGTLGEIFTDTATRGKAASCAMGIPLGQVREALDIVLRQIQQDSVPIVAALRYVRASAATLAFTSHRPYTCILEIDGPRSRGVLTTYQRIWRALKDAGITYTFHWGKMNNLHLNSNRVREIYDQKVDAWLNVRRTLLPTPELRRVFANEFLRKLNMDS